MTLAPEQKRTDSSTNGLDVAAGSGGHGRTDIDRLIDERVPGYSLAAPFYISPELFARDIEGIFASTWIFVASVAEVPEAGDYLTIDIGAYSVIVIRDDDGEIRAQIGRAHV